MVKKVSPSSDCFGARLREARERAGLAQDHLGVLIGLDEGCASARISRYETGVHQPQFETARKLAAVLQVPVTYFYCESDWLAALVCRAAQCSSEERAALDDWFSQLEGKPKGPSSI